MPNHQGNQTPRTQHGKSLASRHTLARSSSYNPLEPCPRGMWPNESYDEDTEQYLHRGPQLTSEEWLADSTKSRRPVDLQKNLEAAAEGPPGPVNAATKVAPWLQSQQ